MAKKIASLSFDADFLEGIDKKRGLISRSAYVQHLLEKAMLDQDASFLAPPLKDAKVKHTATRAPKTKIWYLEQSSVFPRDDSPSGPMPHNVIHDRQLKGRADEVRQGVHWLNPTRCEFCRYILQDFSG